MVGTVLRIEKGSMHDGDGLRTVVFMKGCPLHCWWCSTPESQRFEPELGIVSDRCVGCGHCVAECPTQALSLDENHKVLRDKSKCINCFHCVDACLQSVHKKYGSKMTVAEVLRIIEQDQVSYFFSGGGVTFSGGECLGQMDFMAEVLKGCYSQGISTAIESAMIYPWEETQKVLPYLNTIYMDMKLMDETLHKKYVGSDLTRPHDNLRRIDASPYPVKLRLRVPTIPGINDNMENMTALVELCRGLTKVERIELLPYHRLGTETYRNLGLSYQLAEVKTPDEAHMIDLVTQMNRLGGTVPVYTGNQFYQ
ncbi:MAG: glycyl-radical enzyme activating protein [Oscillospiraceae bacterium]